MSATRAPDWIARQRALQAFADAIVQWGICRAYLRPLHSWSTSVMPMLQGDHPRIWGKVHNEFYCLWVSAERPGGSFSARCCCLDVLLPVSSISGACSPYSCRSQGGVGPLGEPATFDLPPDATLRFCRQAAPLCFWAEESVSTHCSCSIDVCCCVSCGSTLCVDLHRELRIGRCLCNIACGL